MACNFTGWYIVYIDNVSLIKNVSVFEILELRHEISQVAASQCEVCGGSVETPTHVVDFWKIDTLGNVIINMTSCRSCVTSNVQNYAKL